MDFLSEPCRACIHYKVCAAIKTKEKVYQEIKKAVLSSPISKINYPFYLEIICPEYINRNNLRKIERGEH